MPKSDCWIEERSKRSCVLGVADLERMLSLFFAYCCRSPADNQLGDLYEFDPSDNTWTNLTSTSTLSMPSAREGAGFLALHGRLYLFGGFSGLLGAYGELSYCLFRRIDIFNSSP